MKNKLIGFLSVAILLSPMSALAAPDRAIIETIAGNGAGSVDAYTHFMDAGSETQYYGVHAYIGTSTDAGGITDSINAAVKAYGLVQGWNLTSFVWPWLTATETQAMASTTATTLINALSLPSAMSFATPTRSLNSAFQVSASRASFVSYTVDIATTLSLTGGQTGTVTLQYADDSGFTTNVKSIQSSVNGNTGTLTIGLALTQTASAAVTGIIPAGKYVRIATANTTGTPTFTYRTGQEVLMPSN